MYLSYYGLKAEPFLLTPDHRFYFESSVHSQAMAHQVYGIKRGEGFIVVTGEVGAGKTTLVKQLCACVDPRRIVAAHVVTTMVSGADLLRLVMAAFGIPDIPSEKGAMLLRLQQFLEQVHRKGKRAILLIDEAQNRAASALEELRMISNFQIGAYAPMQTFLIGQPQFRDVISDPDLEQLRQRIVTSYHLGPMSKEEVGKYIPHRLAKVGWRRDPDFEDGFVDAIFQFTEGVPRRINALASRMLLYGFLEKVHRFTAGDVEKVAADLMAESPRTVSAIAAPSGMPADAVITDRLDRIEDRLREQEEHVASTIAGMRELLKLAIVGRDKNFLAGN
jgi:putative secretion ATPase (PEP-CTERM system associated)